MTDEYFLVYEGRSGYYTKEGRLIMSYNRETGNWGLYVPDYVTNRVFKLICGELNIKEPERTIHQFKIREIKGSNNEFPAQMIAFPKNRQDRDWRTKIQTTKLVRPTPEQPDGISLIKSPYIHIEDGKLTWIKSDIGDIDPFDASMASFCHYRLVLPNDIEVEFKRAWNKWDKFFLTRMRDIDGRKVWYPVDIEGNPTTENADTYWDMRHGNNKFYRVICENGLYVGSSFSFDKMKYHFYGKGIKVPEIKKYLRDMLKSGCKCERCRGYLIFQQIEKHAPSYYGWGKDHYKCIHAAHTGTLPTDYDMIMDCNCKACKAFRNTLDRKQTLQEKLYRDEFRSKAYDHDEITYLTADWNADMCIKPHQIKKPDEQSVDDFLWRARAKHFKNLFAIEYERKFPLHFGSSSFRAKLAFHHCRLNGIEWKDAGEGGKAAEWLQEVFSTMLKPDCDCYVCKNLKEMTEASIDVYQELLLDRVDQRAYPTAIVGIHFNTSNSYWARQTVVKKQDVFDYFEKYVLYGKFCECPVFLFVKYCTLKVWAVVHSVHVIL